MRKKRYAPSGVGVGALKPLDYQDILRAEECPYYWQDELASVSVVAGRMVEGVNHRGRGTRTNFGQLSALEATHKLCAWIAGLGEEQQQAVLSIFGENGDD